MTLAIIRQLLDWRTVINFSLLLIWFRGVCTHA